MTFELFPFEIELLPEKKCHDIVFINEAEKSEGGILLLHNQLKKLFAAK